MYHQIAANRRKSVVVIFLFFAFWLLAGYGIGRIGSPSGGVTGAVIAGILALLAVLYALTLGRATIPGLVCVAWRPDGFYWLDAFWRHKFIPPEPRSRAP